MSTRYDDPGERPRRHWQASRDDRGLYDGWGRLRAYLAGLSAEHWLLFIAGLVLGLILG